VGAGNAKVGEEEEGSAKTLIDLKRGALPLKHRTAAGAGGESAVLLLLLARNEPFSCREKKCLTWHNARRKEEAISSWEEMYIAILQAQLLSTEEIAPCDPGERASLGFAVWERWRQLKPGRKGAFSRMKAFGQ